MGADDLEDGQLRCLRCGHIWRPNARTASRGVLPKACPKCHRQTWNRKKPPKKAVSEVRSRISREYWERRKREEAAAKILTSTMKRDPVSGDYIPPDVEVRSAGAVCTPQRPCAACRRLMEARP